jgi:hypothetical protein
LPIMSAELIVKKRGRPKKVVPEAEIEIPESLKKKATTRAKSTKTIAATAKTTKSAKAKPITSTKTITASPAKSKIVVASKSIKVTKTVAKIEAPITVNHPETPQKASSAPATSAIPKSTTTKTVTSKIPTPTLSKAVKSREKPTITAPTTLVDEHTAEAQQVLGKAAPVTSKIPELEPNEDTKAFSELSTTIPTISSAQKQAASSPSSLHPPVQVKQISTSTSTNSPTTSQITPETSKILKEVRELSQKNPPSLFENSLSTESATNTVNKPASAPDARSVPPVATPSTTVKEIPRMSPPSDSKPPPNANPKPNPKPHIPIAGLNKEIVSNITARAGARPRPAGNNGLPPSYNNVARKVTMAIVAAPIAIVTSYVLYQRRK